MAGTMQQNQVAESDSKSFSKFHESSGKRMKLASMTP